MSNWRRAFSRGGGTWRIQRISEARESVGASGETHFVRAGLGRAPGVTSLAVTVGQGCLRGCEAGGGAWMRTARQVLRYPQEPLRDWT